MRRKPLAAGALLLGGAWSLAALDHSMTGHMLAHMTAVAVAAPLIALGAARTAFDPAARWPRVSGPIQMSLVELGVVWLWHTPAARAFAAGSPVGLAIEQLAFGAAGVLLWSACSGAAGTASTTRRAAAVVALLLTTMHMTLLGALLALAPRSLYAGHGAATFGIALTPLEDQQLAGVVMLAVGGASYLAGGVWLLAGLLRAPRRAEIRRWS